MLFIWANTELRNLQSYSWQRYLSRSKCSCMWAWPLAFEESFFRTIQSQAVSWKDCTARSSKLLGLGKTVALNPDSAYILILRVPNALFPAKPTEGCLAVTLCAHGCLPAKIKWSDRNRMTAVPAALTLLAFFSRTRRLRVASYFGLWSRYGIWIRKVKKNFVEREISLVFTAF